MQAPQSSSGGGPALLPATQAAPTVTAQRAEPRQPAASRQPDSQQAAAGVEPIEAKAAKPKAKKSLRSAGPEVKPPGKVSYTVCCFAVS